MRSITRGILAAATLLATATAHADPIELVAADDHGVTLRLTVAGERLIPESDPRAAEQTGRMRLEVPGFGLIDAPGRASLPYATTWVALPPGATARLRVLDPGVETTRDRVPIAIA